MPLFRVRPCFINIFVNNIFNFSFFSYLFFKNSVFILVGWEFFFKWCTNAGTFWCFLTFVSPLEESCIIAISFSTRLSDQAGSLRFFSSLFQEISILILLADLELGEVETETSSLWFVIFKICSLIFSTANGVKKLCLYRGSKKWW